MPYCHIELATIKLYGCPYIHCNFIVFHYNFQYVVFCRLPFSADTFLTCLIKVVLYSLETSFIPFCTAPPLSAAIICLLNDSFTCSLLALLHTRQPWKGRFSIPSQYLSQCGSFQTLLIFMKRYTFYRSYVHKSFLSSLYIAQLVS